MTATIAATYPDWLQQALSSSRVTIVGSRLTDCRALEQWLTASGIDFQRLPLTMDSADNRAAFHALQAQLNWPFLPMLFLDGEFLGGEPELRARLQEPSRGQIGADNISAQPADISVKTTSTSAETRLPLTLQVLAYAGLLPFFAGAVASWWSALPFALLLKVLLVPYAALIASFMAGSHWGLVVTVRPLPRFELLAAVSFMLFSWPLLLLPDTLALTGLLVIFTGLLATEPRLRRHGLISPAYARLRQRLSVGVLLSLAAVLLAHLR